MKCRIIAPALAEVREAARFYEGRVGGLGFEFLAEVRATIERIMANPEAWASLDREIRRCRTRRFPYGVVYAVEGEEVVVIAVMHLHRHPDSWRLGGGR